ncbi:MAG TPA: hypothetical protein VM076_19520 [Gemmatimonadaceae bacterium]|nr:hypothetical protein [Gemmatimonadaceae bacterium]
MRAAILALILAVPRAPLTAQQPSAIQPAPAQRTAESTTARLPAGATTAAVVELDRAAIDSLHSLIARFRRDPQATPLPPIDQIAMGGRTIAAGTQVAGPVAAAGGPIHVYGTVEGDVVAISGDVIVHSGGRITGNAVSALGSVKLDGGTVAGEMRQLSGAIGAIPRVVAGAPESRVGATRHALALAGSWLVILVLIGIGVYVFANDYLDAVTESLEGRFGRSFWAGVAAQLALAPVLALLCIALAVTIIGVLLIPFAIVAFVLAVVGLITLGFLAVARITGESMSPSARRAADTRGAMLRALVVGVVLYMGLWVVASAFAWAPVMETIFRGIAVAITWVAATAGLGAAVLSRGGTRRPRGPLAAAVPVNDLPWQTPTPVTGVVAARRPTPSHTSRER